MIHFGKSFVMLLSASFCGLLSVELASSATLIVEKTFSIPGAIIRRAVSAGDGQVALILFGFPRDGANYFCETLVRATLDGDAETPPVKFPEGRCEHDLSVRKEADGFFLIGEVRDAVTGASLGSFARRERSLGQVRWELEFPHVILKGSQVHGDGGFILFGEKFLRNQALPVAWVQNVKPDSSLGIEKIFGTPSFARKLSFVATLPNGSIALVGDKDTFGGDTKSVVTAYDSKMEQLWESSVDGDTKSAVNFEDGVLVASGSVGLRTPLVAKINFLGRDGRAVWSKNVPDFGEIECVPSDPIRCSYITVRTDGAKTEVRVTSVSRAGDLSLEAQIHLNDWRRPVGVSFATNGDLLLAGSKTEGPPSEDRRKVRAWVARFKLH